MSLKIRQYGLHHGKNLRHRAGSAPQLAHGVSHTLRRSVGQRAFIGILGTHIHLGVDVLHPALHGDTRREVEFVHSRGIGYLPYVRLVYAASGEDGDASGGEGVDFLEQRHSLQRRGLLSRCEDAVETKLHELLQRLAGVTATVESAVESHRHSLCVLHEHTVGLHVDGAVLGEATEHHAVGTQLPCDVDIGSHALQFQLRVEEVAAARAYDDMQARRLQHPSCHQNLAIRLAGDRLQPPVFNGFIWRFLFDAAILRDNAITFEGAYLEDELFLMEYFANVHRLAVTDKPLYRYLENPASATHRYMRDYPAVFARFLERKAEIVEKYGLDAARPQWRANTVWAGLLIAVGNEYVKSNPKPVREKRKAVEALCAQPEFAKAIRELHPKGLGRNKQIVADLIGSGRFGTLTALYRLKNHM